MNARELMRGPPRVVGETEEDTQLLLGSAERARAYLLGHEWCQKVLALRLGVGVGGVVAVFLAQVVPAKSDVDEWLWVIEGDLPSAYLVLDDLPSAVEALECYCQLMDEWSRAVVVGSDLDSSFPVSASPTPENARALLSRVEFLRERVIPKFA